LQIFFALNAKRIGAEKFRFENAFSVPDSRRRARACEIPARIKPLFHRTICIIGVFALL